MKKDCINVLMAVNKNYLTQMKTLICSLGENNDPKLRLFLEMPWDCFGMIDINHCWK